MQGLARTLADPSVRDGYLLFCFALLVLPMLGLARWYHARITRTAGGRALMQRQAATPPARGGGLGTAHRSMAEAGAMAGDIAEGRYGDDAKRLQVVVYWVTGLWLLANAIAFAILIWADEVNRASG